MGKRGKPANQARAAKSDLQERAMLEKLIQPQGRDRWMIQRIRNFTPQRVEQVLMSAFYGDLVAQWELFDLMEDSWPRLGKNLGEVKGAVLAMDWQVQPWAPRGGEASPEAQRRADLFDQAIWSMRPRADEDEAGFEDTLLTVLDAWGKGISVLEVDWELRDGLIAPRCTRWVHPRYYGYPPEENGLRLKLSEVRRSNPEALAGNQSDWARLPEDQFIVAVHKQKSGHPIGGALLRSLAPWWTFMHFGAEWLLNFAQVFGMPIRWATYDPNNGGLMDLISGMLENMGSCGWGVFPSGTALELKEAARSASDNPQVIIYNLAQKECDTRILGQTLTTDAGDRGTQALGTVHASVRGDVIAYLASWAAAVLSGQLARAFCRLNFGDDNECPFLVPGAEAPKDAESMARRDQILIASGVPVPLPYLYERHEIPPPGPDEAVVERAAVPSMPPLAPNNGQPPEELPAQARASEPARELARAQAEDLGPLREQLERVLGLTDPADMMSAAQALLAEYPKLAREVLQGTALAARLEHGMADACVAGAVAGGKKLEAIHKE